jgi:hypothetical protein
VGLPPFSSRLSFVPPAHLPWPAMPGTGTSCGVWVWRTFCPSGSVESKSLRPLYEQFEFEFVGAPVVFGLPPGWAVDGLPGGPFTSPASAPLAAAPTSTATEAATTRSRFTPFPPSVDSTLPLASAATLRVTREEGQLRQSRARRSNYGRHIPRAHDNRRYVKSARIEATSITSSPID